MNRVLERKKVVSSYYSEYQYATASVSNGEASVEIADLMIAQLSRLGIKRICDLGCGNGYLVGRLSTLGFNVSGIDASASGIDVARNAHPQARFHCRHICANLRQEIGEGDFDAVASCDVIEHLYRPSDLLEAASELLPIGGHLLVCTPYHGYWKNLALSITGRMDAHFTALWDGGHVKFFSVKTLSELVHRHGFKVEVFSFYGRLPWLLKNMICHARKVA